MAKTPISPQLLIPEELLPRILAALRRRYPDVTAGLGDVPAFAAVVRYWIARDLAAEESTAAAGDERALIEKRRSEAADKARRDAEAIDLGP